MKSPNDVQTSIALEILQAIEIAMLRTAKTSDLPIHAKRGSPGDLLHSN